MASHLELTEDPSHVLAAAAQHLASDPVLTTVLSSVTARLAAGGEYAGAPHRWWAIVRDETGVVVGIAMRTAPFAPYPAYVLPMPDDAATELARVLHERGESLGGVNGALPAARVVAEETARLTGGSVEVHEHLRLFELADLVEPVALPPGRLRPAIATDADLVLAWYHDFGRAAAEQAGRTEPHGSPTEVFTVEEVAERIEAGVVFLWEAPGGATVHLTAMSPPAYGVSRIGPVYTPREHRARGYASAAVAAVSRRILDAGDRACLFTDQANPTSNKIYEALGYRPVVDMVNLLVH